MLRKYVSASICGVSISDMYPIHVLCFGVFLLHRIEGIVWFGYSSLLQILHWANSQYDFDVFVK